MSDYDKINAKLDDFAMTASDLFSETAIDIIEKQKAALRRALEGFNAFERGLFSKRNADKISSEIKRDIAKILDV